MKQEMCEYNDIPYLPNDFKHHQWLHGTVLFTVFKMWILNVLKPLLQDADTAFCSKGLRPFKMTWKENKKQSRNMAQV